MYPARRRQTHSPDRILLVGWDAADWQLIRPLVEQGLMPTFASLLERGAWGNLATTRPILSPMLWNTIATGKRPQQHGVHGFTEPKADGSGIQPVASTSRKCKAIWNILTQCGLKSNIVGWYASHPAEPIDGVMVSNQFECFQEHRGEFSPVVAGSVHPAAQAEKLGQFRVAPSEIDASAILPFVPTAASLLEKAGNRLGKLQRMLAQTATVHAVATQLMATTEWDFTAIYYEGIDRFGHEFMGFHPPKMEQVSPDEFEAYQHCMVGIYRFHDMLLETLLTLAGDRTAVIVMSDHGYYNDHLRPDPRGGKSDPVEWHRPFGILAGCGPGFRAGSRLYGASILDVTPTILHLFGLPVGYDMPGRVMAEILADSDSPQRIESWEEVKGPCGMHPAELQIDPYESRAAMQQLVALGYIDAPSDDAEKAVQQTITSNQSMLIQSLIDSYQFSDALAVIAQIDPAIRSEEAVRFIEVTCYLGMNDRQRARAILQQLIADNCTSPRLEMMLGALEFADGNPKAALAHLQKAAGHDARLPNLQNKLGEIYLETKRYDLAIEAFTKAREIDGDSPVAFAGLARAHLELGDAQKALDLALIAAEFVHHFPRVHYTIGRAHLALGDPQAAAEALELCVRQAPQMNAAYKSLASAYRSLGQTDKAMAADLRANRVLA